MPQFFRRPEFSRTTPAVVPGGVVGTNTVPTISASPGRPTEVGVRTVPPRIEDRTTTVQGAPPIVNFVSDFLTGLGGGDVLRQQDFRQRRIQQMLGQGAETAQLRSLATQRGFENQLSLANQERADAQLRASQEQQRSLVSAREAQTATQQQLLDLSRERFDFQKQQALNKPSVNLKELFGKPSLAGIKLPDTELDIPTANFISGLINTNVNLDRLARAGQGVSKVNVDNDTGIVTIVDKGGNVRHVQTAKGVSFQDLLKIEDQARKNATSTFGGIVPPTPEGRAQFQQVFQQERARIISELTGTPVDPQMEIIPGGSAPEVAAAAARTEAVRLGAKGDGIVTEATKIIKASPVLTEEEKREAIRVLTQKSLASRGLDLLDRLFGPTIEAFQGKRSFVTGAPRDNGKRTLTRKK